MRCQEEEEWKEKEREECFKSQRNEKAKFRVNQCEGCNLFCEQGTQIHGRYIPRALLLGLFNYMFSKMDAFPVASNDAERS